MHELLHQCAGDKSITQLDDEQHAKLYGAAVAAMSRGGCDLKLARFLRRVLNLERFKVYRPPDFLQQLIIFQHDYYPKASSHVEFTPAQQAQLLTMYGHGPYELGSADAATRAQAFQKIRADWWRVGPISNTVQGRTNQEFIPPGGVTQLQMPMSHTTLSSVLKSQQMLDWSTFAGRVAARLTDRNPYLYRPRLEDRVRGPLQSASSASVLNTDAHSSLARTRHVNVANTIVDADTAAAVNSVLSTREVKQLSIDTKGLRAGGRRSSSPSSSGATNKPLVTTPTPDVASKARDTTRRSSGSRSGGRASTSAHSTESPFVELDDGKTILSAAKDKGGESGGGAYPNPHEDGK